MVIINYQLIVEKQTKINKRNKNKKKISIREYNIK